MTLVWILCFVLLAFFHSAVAREYVVGGRKGWVVPSGSEPETYQQWSSRNRFLIGDTLLFKYNPAEDSVVQVTAHHYDACNKSSPIASYKGGNTVFRLPRHGPFHFISGNRSNCQKGEKLTVVVIAPRNRSHGAPTPTAAPAPSPSSIPAPTTKSPSSAPSPAPVVGAPSPSPTPVGAAPSPSSSPAPLLDVPSPSPVSPTLSPPSPLTATPSSSTPSSLPSPSTATPSSSSPTPPASASPPALVTALNLVIPLLFALKILPIY